MKNTLKMDTVVSYKCQSASFLAKYKKKVNTFFLLIYVLEKVFYTRKVNSKSCGRNKYFLFAKDLVNILFPSSIT